jgi:hypothetical protein
MSGGRIVNYPKEHIANGEAKNKGTSQAYKPTVRQIKRLRRNGVTNGLIAPDQAPGYLLECMTFNAPASAFSGDEAARVGAVLRWLDQHTAEGLAAESGPATRSTACSWTTRAATTSTRRSGHSRRCWACCRRAHVQRY